jgi:adenylate cyclase
VVVDVVESVRLMQQHETDVINRWRRFVNEVQTQVLPKHGGRLVKSLGDGMLLEFESVPFAITAALEMQRRVCRYNDARNADSAMLLRIGAHLADVVVDDIDLFGAGVNLAARLTTLAGPGETVVSAEVRDQLTDGLDAHIADLGECFLKHYTSAVRAYRISPAGEAVARMPALIDCFEPAVAVVPLSILPGDARGAALGNALADDIIAALSRTTSLKVVSRLSTAAFCGPSVKLEDIRTHLGAAYVVSGRCTVRGEVAGVRIELCDARDGAVLWADAMQARVSDIFHGQDVVVPKVVANVSRQISRAELRRVRCLPLSTLEAYTLYSGSVSMLHRLSLVDFARSRELLEQLSQRQPRSAAPQAMLAKWHVLRMVQGWSPDLEREGQLAQHHARCALALDADHSFALSVDALVTAHFGDDLDTARARAIQATVADPQESHAWLVLSGIQTYLGNGSESESFALRAIDLSPMDPARFAFDVFASAGKLSAGKFDEAAAWARASIRRNAMHPASHRLLTIALSLGGRHEAAREASLGLLKLDPTFSISRYAARYPGRHHSHARTHVEALRAAGVPE